MSSANSANRLIRGMICLSLAVGFEEDRVRIGLPGAIGRLRTALIENDLWLCGDDQLLLGVLTGRVSSEQLAEALCSMKRMRLPGGTTH
jgi:hypothetical protein